MRKTMIVGLGLALSFAGVAAAQQPGRGEARREPGDVRGFRGRGGPDGLLLKGITLTETQRTQIAQFRRTQQDQAKARRDEMRKQREVMRAARQQGDTAAVRQLAQAQRAERDQVRKAHLAGIRNILTAEQRVQFDRNVAEFEQRMAQRGQSGARGQDGGRGFRGHRGPKRGGGAADQPDNPSFFSRLSSLERLTRKRRPFFSCTS